MDKDGDGRISAAEWQGPAGMFSRLDADRDGYLSPGEISRNRRQDRPVGPNRPNPRGVDADNDGKISRDEWKGAGDKFVRMDANGDGYITSDERPRNGGRGARARNAK
jgi:Ca2+-binding EF-hand superfamily protein